jgi:tyrosyl-tRNA synthetase
LGYVAFLRDIGQHFSVNRMLTAEGTKQRLERDQGLSFVEFNYHLLQSYDYLVLYRRHGCTLQLGGDDQWFNILGGAELIRREHGALAHCATVPLLATATGQKMGKTERGAVWLAADRLGPYDYFQHWLNVDDRDVGPFLRLYTFLDLDRIRELEALQGADLRIAKRALAREATALAHGEDAAAAADEAARKAFAGDSSEDMPSFAAAFPAPLISVLVDSGLCSSRSEARRLIDQGGVRIADVRVTAQDHVLAAEAVVWAGRKRAVRVIALRKDAAQSRDNS